MITTADVLAPIGEFEADFIEDENVPSADSPEKTVLELRLDIYIAQGYSKLLALGLTAPDADTAVLNWTYYRAFKAAFMIKNNKPISEDDKDKALGAFGFNPKQIAAFETRSLEFLGLFEEEIARLKVTSGSFVAPTGYFGRETKNRFEY